MKKLAIFILLIMFASAACEVKDGKLVIGHIRSESSDKPDISSDTPKQPHDSDLPTTISDSTPGDIADEPSDDDDLQADDLQADNLPVKAAKTDNNDKTQKKSTGNNTFLLTDMEIETDNLASKDHLETVIKKHKNDVINCYKSVRNQLLIKSGMVEITIVVDKNGKVKNIDPVKDEFDYEMFTCIKSKAMKWNFGKQKKDIKFNKSWNITDNGTYNKRKADPFDII